MSDSYQNIGDQQILTFKKCTLTKLDKTFSLQQVFDSQVLQDWLGRPAEISDFERQSLQFYQQVLQRNVYDWNETELIECFIGPIFTLVNFTTDCSNLFAERVLEGAVEGIEMRGEPDGMVASGKREPEKPYFCFQEYKRYKDPAGDPAAQCLAAMLVAQAMNQVTQPIYGCYVVGREWSFMVLQERVYAMSMPYLAVREDIFDIFRILKALKQIIAELVALES